MKMTELALMDLEKTAEIAAAVSMLIVYQVFKPTIAMENIIFVPLY